MKVWWLSGSFVVCKFYSLYLLAVGFLPSINFYLLLLLLLVCSWFPSFFSWLLSGSLQLQHFASVCNSTSFFVLPALSTLLLKKKASKSFIWNNAAKPRRWKRLCVRQQIKWVKQSTYLARKGYENHVRAVEEFHEEICFHKYVTPGLHSSHQPLLYIWDYVCTRHGQPTQHVSCQLLTWQKL